MFTTPTTSVLPPGPVVRAQGSSVADRAPQPVAASAKASDMASDTPSQGSAPAAPEPQPSQLKLVVAKAESSLAYTYTLVDQVTGRVVAAIPFEAAEKAASSPNYTAGGVVDTHA